MINCSTLPMKKEARMVDLPKKKVGIVACSGEEFPEGTVTRLAALKVLEQLRPADTVTICLPLFLAGGEGDRAFARFYPTIAVDGCDKRCAARATEMYSGKPAASIVVSDLVNEHGLDQPTGQRRLNEAGQRAVEVTADHLADLVDELLGKRWNRREGAFVEPLENTRAEAETQAGEAVVATCSCGSGIPIQSVIIDGQKVTLIALPLIFQQFCEAGKQPSTATVSELLEAVRVYNPIPSGAEEAYANTILREYAAFCTEKETA
jgi:uncharacterized metal-binding protein